MMTKEKKKTYKDRMIRFPLPYSSLSSLYLGLILKNPCDWVKPKQSIFQDRTNVSFTKHTWNIRQLGVVFPYYSEFYQESRQLYLRLNLDISHIPKTFSNGPIEYVEELTIQHVMENVYHLLIYSQKIENKKKTVLLDNQYKWMSPFDIHHLILEKESKKKK